MSDETTFPAERFVDGGLTLDEVAAVASYFNGSDLTIKTSLLEVWRSLPNGALAGQVAPILADKGFGGNQSSAVVASESGLNAPLSGSTDEVEGLSPEIDESTLDASSE